ncbi:MAG: hypothetical protein ACJA0H_002532 [Francisellaceae bacterium]|jgi:uncharacterized protein involved in outer membrane biogenesis
MKFIKWASITIICLIVLIIISLLLLPKLISANQFKPLIEARIKQQSGRNLTLNGDISWSILPTVSLQVNNGVVSNPKNFSKMGNFATFDKVTASVQLLPLLRGEVKINSLKYSGVTINLKRLEDGEDNWHFIKERLQSLSLNKNENSTKVILENENTNKQLSMSINEITLKNVRINYQNNNQSWFILLNRFNIKLHLDENTHSTDYKLDVNFSTKNVKNASSAGSGRVSFGSNTIILENISQQFNFISRSFGSYNANVSGNIIYNSKTNLITSNISFYVQNLLNAYFRDISYNSKSNNYSLEATIDSAQEAEILNQFNINLPTSDTVDPNVAWDIQDLTFNVKGSQNKVDFQNINGNIGRSEINGDISIINIENHQSEFNLTIRHLNTSDYINLGKAEIFFQSMRINGNLNNNLESGEINLKAKSAIISGIDLNRVAIKFQNFLRSIVNMNNVGKNFQEMRHELMALNLLGANPNIDKNNGKETKMYNFLMVNSIKDHTIYSRELSWDGKDFTLKGNGQVDWQTKTINYALRSYVYNPKNSDLQPYQQIYIPFTVYGKIGEIKFSGNQEEIEKQLQPIMKKTLENVINDKANNLLKQLTH